MPLGELAFVELCEVGFHARRREIAGRLKDDAGAAGGIEHEPVHTNYLSVRPIA